MQENAKDIIVNEWILKENGVQEDARKTIVNDRNLEEWRAGGRPEDHRE